MVPVQFHSSADMEWGANPQRAGHCNVEPLPGESSHWRKLRRRERAKKRSQDTFCVESPQGGICFAISAQNYGFARFFIYRPASIQFSKRAQAYVRAFIRQGRGAIPSRILSENTDSTELSVSPGAQPGARIYSSPPSNKAKSSLRFRMK